MCIYIYIIHKIMIRPMVFFLTTTYDGWDAPPWKPGGQGCDSTLGRQAASFQALGIGSFGSLGICSMSCPPVIRSSDLFPLSWDVNLWNMTHVDDCWCVQHVMYPFVISLRLGAIPKTGVLSSLFFLLTLAQGHLGTPRPWKWHTVAHLLKIVENYLP